MDDISRFDFWWSVMMFDFVVVGKLSVDLKSLLRGWKKLFEFVYILMLGCLYRLLVFKRDKEKYISWRFI